MLESKSAAMVSVAQWQWDFSQPDWQQTVGWAVGEAGVSHLLLVGHSQSVAEQAAGGHESSDTGIARRPISGSRSVNGFATERLFNGARQVQLQLRQARQHYSEQVAAACQVPPVAESLQQGKLQLHTLFYMAQTNAFHHFDVKNGQFRPLS